MFSTSASDELTRFMLLQRERSQLNEGCSPTTGAHCLPQRLVTLTRACGSRALLSKCTLGVHGLARAAVNAPASVRSLTVARNVSDAVRDRAPQTTRVYVTGTGVDSSSRLLAGSD